MRTVIKKSNLIHVRGTPEQYTQWKVTAAREGRSVSNWAARVLDAYLESLGHKRESDA